MDNEIELTCSMCNAKLTGEEGMDICIPCQEGPECLGDDDWYSQAHGSLIVKKTY